MQEVLDRLAIEDVLAAYCERIDAYDIDAATEGFLAECRVEYGQLFEGLAAFREHLKRSQARFLHVHHQLGQVLVELDGDTAASIAYATATHHHLDGGYHQSFIQYRDRWTRTPEGWRIAQRKAFVGALDRGSRLEGSGAPANWVPRDTPSGR